MKTITQRIQDIDHPALASGMNEKGYHILKSFLTVSECDELRNSFNESTGFRKTIVMERYRFGKGVYKYFGYPLKEIIQEIRREMYAVLAPVANEWMNNLRLAQRFPASLKELGDICIRNNQKEPTVLILQYEQGGFNTLHQDLYGNVYFPIQLVICLTEPGEDFKGGEFVLTEQVPRAQSKAIVLKPGLGDIVIFTTNFRPVKGSKGFYKANMKHGVSEVTSGSRTTLGIIFHDAIS